MDHRAFDRSIAGVVKSARLYWGSPHSNDNGSVACTVFLYFRTSPRPRCWRPELWSYVLSRYVVQPSDYSGFTYARIRLGGFAARERLRGLAWPNLADSWIKQGRSMRLQTRKEAAAPDRAIGACSVLSHVFKGHLMQPSSRNERELG